MKACYLCGKPLLGDREAENDDHVPPEQLLARSLRKAENKIKLITLRVHKSCNQAYSSDEEYFTQVLIPFARGSVGGNAVWEKAVADYRDGKRRPLIHRILGQGRASVRGVMLPAGKLWLDLEHERFDRVVAKIIRGLHFLETQRFLALPDDISVRLTLPDQTPPDDFERFMTYWASDSKGQHQGVFAYRNAVADDLHYWAVLLWDRILITACFKEAGADPGPNLSSQVTPG
ncbi:hypothetical protein [Rhizobium leguminosarum]|uniref:hypothetical protein n=1 Tax=Rhizobium leguminosarum TaxID=384 RepID=UPI001031EB3F|nr:hypothetical protein [Rhizobium leguminosarum]TAU84616.1 hypothetical protein ELI40_15765 [Rhizobium leguminosarum]TAX10768.1 hypothetical protein ELI07_15290 [Rhizobium leguminosarum]TAY13511.1 hypothetical protein ELH96_17880 [Rhizobium leguminosarum]TAZ15435.1 hypothetical protein ELH81_15800 [Rhizobium leguminosarum]